MDGCFHESGEQDLFLFAANCLAQYPYRVKRLIHDGRSHYSVRLCSMGEWREVIIDGKFPGSQERQSLLACEGLEES